MNKPLRILVLEDRPDDAEMLIREVRRAGYAPEWCRRETEADFLAELANPPDLILSDYEMPHFDGVRAVVLLRQRGLDTPFILISGTLGEEAAVAAIKLGADDFLLKDRTARLGVAIEHVLEEKRLRREHARAELALRQSEKRYRTLFETMSEGFCTIEMIFAADGRPVDHRFLEVNPAFEGQTGLHDAQGKSMRDLAPDYEAHWFEICGNVASTGVPAHFESAVKAQGRFYDVHAYRVGGPESRKIGILFNDITARKQSEQKLAQSHEQLRALLARLQQGQEAERIRMAREIHDELGQSLTGLKMDLRWLERKLSAPGLPAVLNPLLDRAVAASELVDATIAAVQKIAAELRPGSLDQLGLAAALTERARRFAERSGIHCAVTVSETGGPLSPEIATELFYICQEALTNTARHARAKHVKIHLQTDTDTVLLELRDDGVGIGSSDLNASHSLGLLGMKERARQCGGTIDFHRGEPCGTQIVVRIPRAVAVTQKSEAVR